MKISASKIIVIISWAAFIALSTLCVWFKYSDKDIADMVTLTGFSAAELTAAHGFYFWKSKNENRAKHAQKMVVAMADKYGIESVARIAEIVLKD